MTKHTQESRRGSRGLLLMSLIVKSRSCGRRSTGRSTWRSQMLLLVSGAAGSTTDGRGSRGKSAHLGQHWQDLIGRTSTVVERRSRYSRYGFVLSLIWSSNGSFVSSSGEMSRIVLSIFRLKATTSHKILFRRWSDIDCSSSTISFVANPTREGPSRVEGRLSTSFSATSMTASFSRRPTLQVSNPR